MALLFNGLRETFSPAAKTPGILKQQTAPNDRTSVTTS